MRPLIARAKRSILLFYSLVAVLLAALFVAATSSYAWLVAWVAGIGILALLYMLFVWSRGGHKK